MHSSRKKLMIAVQANEIPWDMKEACRHIIRESRETSLRYSKQDRIYAKALKRAIKVTAGSEPEAFSSTF